MRLNAWVNRQGWLIKRPIYTISKFRCSKYAALINLLTAYKHLSKTMANLKVL
jgi:hypothetical protein